MVDLALHGDGPVARQDIAERQEVSAGYVAQLFRQLAAAGLVEGVKGPGGGYLLARDVAAITAGDVVRAVEGPVALVPCVEPDAEPSCNRIDRCAAHLLWKRLSKTLSDYLDSITLHDLCAEARQLGLPSLSNEGHGAGGKPLCGT
jgi:Rrf2 family protein